ncbi:MAG: MSCRAMM family protein, partial [Planctomycetota bacterium]
MGGRCWIRVGLLAIAVATGWVLTARSTHAQELRPGPVTFEVVGAADGKPVDRVLVRLGGRFAHTGPDGRASLEGVPAGTYALTIEAFGWQRIERPVTLPAGARLPMPVSLEPAKPIEVLLHFASEGIDSPVAGAQVRLEPLEVRAALSGPVDARSGWDGSLRLIDFPPGRYRLSATAPGHVPLVQDVDLTESGEPHLTLKRAVETARLSVRVIDAATGEAVPGARVVVTEGGAVGVLAEEVTGTDGNLAFDLEQGVASRVDAEGRSAVALGPVNVRAEADGYALAVAAGRLGQGEAVTVRLCPTAGVPEQEPNNEGGPAQAILSGAPVTFTITDPKDVDRFSFRVGYRAHVEIVLANPDLEVYVRLLDGAGKRVAERGFYKAAENRFGVDVEPGSFVLQFEEWSRNAASEEPLSFQVNVADFVDSFEPNDEMFAARPLALGSGVTGKLFPANDQDWYRF